MNRRRVGGIMRGQTKIDNMTRNNFLETFGWYGAVVTLLAYALISEGFFCANNIWYQLLNLTGGIGLTAIASYKKDYPLIALNAIWAIIALAMIVKIIYA